MSEIYDNWERLVRKVLRREHDRWLAMLSDASSVSSTSSISDPRSSFKLSHRFDSDYSKSILKMNFTDLMLDHTQWKEMLPPGQRVLVWTSAAHLSFFVDKQSGRNCFLLGATQMMFKECEMVKSSWSRFSEAVICRCQSTFNIRAQIMAKILSPNTFYAIYLVFLLGQNNARENSEEQIRLESIINQSGRMFIKRVISGRGVQRQDRWLEIRFGVFYIDQCHKGQEQVQVDLHEIGMGRTRDIYIEGLEFRPYLASIRDDNFIEVHESGQDMSMTRDIFVEDMDPFQPDTARTSDHDVIEEEAPASRLFKKGR